MEITEEIRQQYKLAKLKVMIEELDADESAKTIIQSAINTKQLAIKELKNELLQR